MEKIEKGKVEGKIMDFLVKSTLRGSEEALNILLDVARTEVNLTKDVWVSQKVFADIIFDIREDRKIQAIKHLRDETSLSLKTSKEAIEEIWDKYKKHGE